MFMILSSVLRDSSFRVRARAYPWICPAIGDLAEPAPGGRRPPHMASLRPDPPFTWEPGGHPNRLPL